MDAFLIAAFRAFKRGQAISDHRPEEASSALLPYPAQKADGIIEAPRQRRPSDQVRGIGPSPLAADAHAGPVVATGAIGRPRHDGGAATVAVWAVGRRNRATWSDAPSVIATSGAGGRVGR
jgi:hypothetical protein